MRRLKPLSHASLVSSYRLAFFAVFGSMWCIWIDILIIKSLWPHRLMVRTAGFHSANRGSIPRGVTNGIHSLVRVPPGHTAKIQTNNTNRLIFTSFNPAPIYFVGWRFLVVLGLELLGGLYGLAVIGVVQKLIF